MMIKNQIFKFRENYPAPTESVIRSGCGGKKSKVLFVDLGTPGHVAGELFKMMAGINMVHVTYLGDGLALHDLISGQLQAMFGVVHRRRN
jgi:hypothetical protein